MEFTKIFSSLLQYGIGTLWVLLGLTPMTSTCPYQLVSKASEEYQSLSGCTTAVPIENDGGTGTACGHWDEDCFQSELMTGFSTGALEMSRVTVGGLEDIGYEVDYGGADAYDASLMDSSCKCSAFKKLTWRNFGSFGRTRYVGNHLDSGERKLSMRRKLSEAGRQTAVAYGQQHLKEMRKRKESLPESTKFRYIGDKFVSVLYAEEGEIYAVEVWGDERGP